MDILNSSENAALLQAVDEAINRLGYLNDGARPFLIDAASQGFIIHPRATATAHRKDGEQLARDELKALGLRANTFMSRKALSEITVKGLQEPLKAHEKTLLRAIFTFGRWRSLYNAARNIEATGIKPGAVSWTYSMLPPVCPRCASLDGEQTTPQTAHILPPDDCECETANYGVHMKVDWFFDID